MRRLPLVLLTLAAAACELRDSAPPAQPTAPTGPPPWTGAPLPPPPMPGPTGATAPPAASLPSPGCAQVAPGKGLLRGLRLTVGGEARAFDLFLPATYDNRRAYSLVFLFHGSGGSPANARAALPLETVAGDAAILAYPQGRQGSWDLGTQASRNADVAFFDALVADLPSRYCVDTTRIFAAGFSMGGYMANQLACRRGPRLRAVASHGGGGPYEDQGRYDDQGNLLCDGGRPSVPVLVVHGQADAEVAPSEGANSVKHWTQANRCRGGPQSWGPPPCAAMTGCAEPLVTCFVPGLGHRTWQRAAEVTWAFFGSLR
jgi:polyhydroxybutyrate depolymerase